MVTCLAAIDRFDYGSALSLKLVVFGVLFLRSASSFYAV